MLLLLQLRALFSLVKIFATEPPIFETVLNGIKIVASIVGTPIDLAEVFELHAAGKTKVVYETRKLEQVNESFEEVEKAAVPARLVFDMK
jgi:alcohol dehydrogenase, propanol-preferring